MRPAAGRRYRICFVADPDGYRIELIDKAFPTPQDPPHPRSGPAGVPECRGAGSRAE